MAITAPPDHACYVRTVLQALLNNNSWADANILPLACSTADMYINGCVRLFKAVPWCAEGLELSDNCRPVPFYATYLKTLAAVWSEARYILLLRDLPTLLPVRPI